MQWIVCMLMVEALVFHDRDNVGAVRKNTNFSQLGWHIMTVFIQCNTTMTMFLHVAINRYQLTHWGRVTHICVGTLPIIGSDNGLSPGRRQAIIWTNAGLLLIGPLGTNFSEFIGEIHSFLFKKMHLKKSSAKGRLFSLGLNELSSLHPRDWPLSIVPLN